MAQESRGSAPVADVESGHAGPATPEPAEPGPARVRRVGMRDVLAVRPFRVLFVAETLSALGDQLARVALTILVYGRTQSAVLAATGYALTMIPQMVGGPLLGVYVDRVPRRTLMIVTDVVRAGLLAVMALPGMPLWALFTLVALVTLASPAFEAAFTASMPDLLPGPLYDSGASLRSMTYQLVQLVGFAGGGVAVAVLGARLGLALDAASFAVSAVLVAVALRGVEVALRPADTGASRGVFRDAAAGARVVFGLRSARWILGIAWVGIIVTLVPEGIAGPLSDQVGGWDASVGLLLAALPAGMALGVWAFERWVPPQRRPALLVPGFAASSAALLLAEVRPTLAVVLPALMLSGALSAYQVACYVAYMRVVPAQVRGRAVALASSGYTAVQGLAVLAAGAVTEVLAPTQTLAVFGAAGVVMAGLFGLRQPRPLVPAEPVTVPGQPGLAVGEPEAVAEPGESGLAVEPGLVAEPEPGPGAGEPGLAAEPGLAGESGLAALPVQVAVANDEVPAPSPS